MASKLKGSSYQTIWYWIGQAEHLGVVPVRIERVEKTPGCLRVRPVTGGLPILTTTASLYRGKATAVAKAKKRIETSLQTEIDKIREANEQVRHLTQLLADDCALERFYELKIERSSKTTKRKTDSRKRGAKR
jgi:hypothetical protein